MERLDNYTTGSTGGRITMKADHKRSEGARYERAAVRAYLRRELKKAGDTAFIDRIDALEDVLNWMLDRQQRYDKAPGGLGRTIKKR